MNHPTGFRLFYGTAVDIDPRIVDLWGVLGFAEASHWTPRQPLSLAHLVASGAALVVSRASPLGSGSSTRGVCRARPCRRREGGCGVDSARRFARTSDMVSRVRTPSATPSSVTTT